MTWNQMSVLLSVSKAFFWINLRLHFCHLSLTQGISLLSPSLFLVQTYSLQLSYRNVCMMDDSSYQNERGENKIAGEYRVSFNLMYRAHSVDTVKGINTMYKPFAITINSVFSRMYNMIKSATQTR